MTASDFIVHVVLNEIRNSDRKAACACVCVWGAAISVFAPPVIDKPPRHCWLGTVRHGFDRVYTSNFNRTVPCRAVAYRAGTEKLCRVNGVLVLARRKNSGSDAIKNNCIPYAVKGKGLLAGKVTP